MSKIINVNNKAMILCFVCDQKVTGEKVNLASSISTHSKVTLPEKISQLIGDDYVVAVTEQDCVCKRCASLLNHMDKLENELTLVKRALMTNIAQKYKINLDGQTPSANPTPSPATPQQVCKYIFLLLVSLYYSKQLNKSSKTLVPFKALNIKLHKLHK